LRPLFHYIAASGVREIFTATALLVVLGAALFMNALGLSMVLGTFIAVGMALNIGILYIHLEEVLIVVLLVTIKSVVLYSLARIFGLHRSVRL